MHILLRIGKLNARLPKLVPNCKQQLAAWLENVQVDALKPYAQLEMNGTVAKIREKTKRRRILRDSRMLACRLQHQPLR